MNLKAIKRYLEVRRDGQRKRCRRQKPTTRAVGPFMGPKALVSCFAHHVPKKGRSLFRNRLQFRIRQWNRLMSPLYGLDYLGGLDYHFKLSQQGGP